MPRTTLFTQRLSRNKAASDQLIEVIDAANRPLLHMPLELIRRQSLRHKAIAVCIRNKHGHIFLHKHPEEGPPEHTGQWNFSATGHVLAGESCYGAAKRRLYESLAVTGIELHNVGTIAASSITKNAEVSLFLSAKTAAIPQLREQDFWDGMFVDKEEFTALARDFPHLVSPVLQLAEPRLFAV